MITITLLGGPRDGEEYSISDDIWRSGYFRIFNLLEPVSWLSEPEIATPKIVPNSVLIYKRQRWNPGWVCAQPMHKWTYQDYKW